MKNPLSKLRLYSLKIETASKVTLMVYQRGGLIKTNIKKALRQGDAITINGRTIWRENSEVTHGPNHDYIWHEDGERILGEEILKVRNDSTSELKIIRGQRKYMNYDRYNKE